MFFSTPNGTAIYNKKNNSVLIEVKSGKLIASGFVFENFGLISSNPSVYIDNKLMPRTKLCISGNTLSVSIPSEIEVNEGSNIEFR